MTLFSTNSIFHMQFRQPMLIPTTDPLITINQFWLKQAFPENIRADTWVVFSVDLRRRFLQYHERLSDPMPSPLMLSSVCKNLKEEWRTMLQAWTNEILQGEGCFGTLALTLVGGNESTMYKPRLWYAALALNLNLTILYQTIRIPPLERLPPPPPGPYSLQLKSIPAFHNCMLAASDVLHHFNDLDKDQLKYGSDTLLHFSVYASTFLGALSRNPEQYGFEQHEVEHIRDLILSVADRLESASAYPESSPALHANKLRSLVRASLGSRSFDEAGGQASAAAEREALIPPSVGFDGQFNAPIPAPDQTPNAAMGEIDIMLGGFPWGGGMGMDGWAGPGSAPQVDPALFDQGGSAPMPGRDEGSVYANGARRAQSPPLPLHGGHA
jgi:hypothetical protein